MADLRNTTLDDIAGVIGFTATVRLAAHYGGRDLHVPINVSSEHPVAKLIGENRMGYLNREWAGQRLSVPSLGVVECEVRAGRVLSLLLAGMSTSQSANLTGLTDRRVQQLKRDYQSEGLLPTDLVKQPEPQPDLRLEQVWKAAA